MTHTDDLACPCRPETRQAVGGGAVQVHRDSGEGEGRRTESTRSPDRHCPSCDQWHLTGHPHLEAAALRALEDAVYALPAEGRRHVGMFIERAGVIGVLDRARKRAAA